MSSCGKRRIGKLETWAKPSARAICAQGVAASAYLIQERISLAAVGGRVVERRGAPLQSNFSAQVKDREINRNEVVCPSVKARSAEVSKLDVSASPRIVKHAKMYHWRGSPGFHSNLLPVTFPGFFKLVIKSFHRMVMGYASRRAEGFSAPVRARGCGGRPAMRTTSRIAPGASRSSPRRFALARAGCRYCP